jgi:hypothetical protein
MRLKRINNPFAVVILACAALFDLLSLIPGANEYVAIAGQVVMGGLFYLSGANIFKDTPAVVFIAATILEAIPGVSVVPSFLIEAIAIIVMSRR